MCSTIGVIANDGHDTSVTTAGKWARNWLTPLLSNPNFNIARTLVILTFDEGTTSGTNQVYAALLGSAIPSALVGTRNSTRYNHYSLTKTVERNWNLGNLGQNDVSASAFFTSQDRTAGVEVPGIRTTVVPGMSRNLVLPC